MTPLQDQTGTTIKPGDILKVFHFIGARRKRHYMYKQAVEYTRHPRGGPMLKISHLNRLADEPWEIGKNFYYEVADGRRLDGYEIIQSCARSQPPEGGASDA
jgi:hypothetical protein